MNNNNNSGGNSNGGNSNNFAQQHSHQSSPPNNGSAISGNDVNGVQQTHAYVHQREVGNGSGGNNAGPDLPQQQQTQQSQPHFQPHNRYLHRDGPATINLPPGTRIQMSNSDQVDAASFQQQEAAALYGQMAYQAAGAAPAGWQTSGYGGGAQMTQTGQYYTQFNPATGPYYANSAANYALTAPQALIMQQSQQVAAAAHQQQVAYAQLMGQHGINQATAHQIISTGGIPVQQSQQQQMPTATAVSHLQQGNVVATNTGTTINTVAGGVPQQTSNPTTTLQSSASQQQQPGQRQGRRILQFVDPASGQALDLGAESKAATATVNTMNTTTAVMDEESKSAVIKTEFLKKVSERVNDELVGGNEAAQSRRSPSFPNEIPQHVPEAVIPLGGRGGPVGIAYSTMPKSASVGVELHSTAVGAAGIGGYDAPHSVPPKMPTPPTTTGPIGVQTQTYQPTPLAAATGVHLPVGGTGQVPSFQIHQKQQQQPQHHHAPPPITTTAASPTSIHPHVSAHPTPLLPPPQSHPIPIEQQHQQAQPQMHHSPKMPSLMEIEVSKPSPQEEQPPQQQQPVPLLQPSQHHATTQHHLPQQPQQKNHQYVPFATALPNTMNSTIHGTALPFSTTVSTLEQSESTKLIVDNVTDEYQQRQQIKSGSEKRNHLPELELNGQSPTPTEGTEEPETPSPEELQDLDKQMQEYEEMRNDTHDTDAMIYSRSFLMFLRKVTRRIKAVKCPKTEEELEELGLSNKGLPPTQSTTGGGKTKRFDMPGGENSFKPAWQQLGGTQLGGGNQYGGSGQRFNTTRPPYSGRHSDNKLKPKKGPIVGRSSFDRPIKLAQVSQQAETLPRKSANAWKSRREERFDMNAPMKDEEEAKYEKMKKDIRGLLNKITPSTYEDLSTEFCAYKVNEDPKLLSPIIDLIFDKAVEEPHFCPLYSDLCKKQVEVERQFLRDKTPDSAQQQPQPQKDKSFRNAIILKCQTTFSDSKSYDEKMQVLEAKLKELSDDKDARVPIEDEIETLRSKEKRRLLGIIKFIGQLYRHQLVVEMIIHWCAVELIKRFTATTDEVYIEYAVQLINTVGKIYEQRNPPNAPPKQAQTPRTMSQVASGEQKQECRLDAILTHLSQMKSYVSSRVRFAIMDLEDLRKSNWNPRGGEKGPKTIEEVREEAVKEQQDNELERIEHERQKEKERLQQQQQGGMRKSSSRGYMGRNSTDRRTAAGQASSMLARESKAESRITSKSRLTDLDNITDLSRSTWKSTHRDRTPQKDEGGGSPSASGGGGGTTTSGTGHAWRSTKSGTDSPKDE